MRMVNRGYTLLELMLAVSLVCILTGISLISIASPKRLMEKQNQKYLVTQILNKAQLRALLTGQATKLSFTPRALWLDEQKALEFEANSPWQWQTDINQVQLAANGDMALIMNSGKASVSPQRAVLQYNQTMMVQVEFNPQQQTLGVVADAR